MRSSQTAFLLPLLLGFAMVRDWQSMRAEYQAEFACARMMGKLDDAGISAYVTEQNRQLNQRIHAEYHRSLPRPTSIAPPVVQEISPSAIPPRPR